MKKNVIFLSAVLLIVASLAFGIDPAHLNRVTITNDTGYDMYYLFGSPGDSNYWGADILGTTRTLDAGEQIGFFLYYPDPENSFDFFTIDEDGDAYQIMDFQVRDGEEAHLSITMEHFIGESHVTPSDMVQVDLVNRTGFDIWYLFFSPGDSQMWGIDVLDDETILGPDDTLSMYVPTGSSGVSYDVLAVDLDNDLYRFDTEISTGRQHYSLDIDFSYIQY